MTHDNLLPYQEALESPVFIVGPLRSGSTLLRLLLDNHQDTNVFGEFEGAVSQARGNQWPTMPRYWHFVNSDRQTRAMNLEIDQRLEYTALVRDFLRQLHQRKPCRLIGASVHSRIDLLPKIWPRARYINLLRDPRDVAKSCIGMGWAGNTYEGAYFWEKVERHRDVLNAQVPESQRLDVRYEDLVSEPQATLRRICDFLDIAFDPQMLGIAGHTSYSCPSAKYANQWSRNMSERDIRWVELRLGSQIEAAGYARYKPAQSPLSLGERIYIFVQNRIYKTRYQIKKWGFGLWVQQFLARKLRIQGWQDRVREKTNIIDIQFLK